MVYLLLGTGFEETEAVAPLDLLRRAGISVLTVGVTGKTVYGGHGIGIEADITLPEVDLTDMEMIVLPGGLGGVASVRVSAEAMEALRFAWEKSANLSTSRPDWRPKRWKSSKGASLEIAERLHSPLLRSMSWVRLPLMAEIERRVGLLAT